MKIMKMLWWDHETSWNVFAIWCKHLFRVGRVRSFCLQNVHSRVWHIAGSLEALTGREEKSFRIQLVTGQSKLRFFLFSLIGMLGRIGHSIPGSFHFSPTFHSHGIRFRIFIVRFVSLRVAITSRYHRERMLACKQSEVLLQLFQELSCGHSTTYWSLSEESPCIIPLWCTSWFPMISEQTNFKVWPKDPFINLYQAYQCVNLYHPLVSSSLINTSTMSCCNAGAGDVFCLWHAWEPSWVIAMVTFVVPVRWSLLPRCFVVLGWFLTPQSVESSYQALAESNCIPRRWHVEGRWGIPIEQIKSGQHQGMRFIPLLYRAEQRLPKEVLALLDAGTACLIPQNSSNASKAGAWTDWHPGHKTDTTPKICQQTSTIAPPAFVFIFF